MTLMKYVSKGKKEIVFDDYNDEREEYGTWWVEMCPAHLRQYKRILKGKVDDGGNCFGTCSVYGCDNPASHYVDFKENEFFPVLAEHENALLKCIREAEAWVPGGYELEINHQYDDDNDDLDGWYAMKYKENDGAYLLYENDYYKQPLIKDKTIKKHNVDIYKVFALANVLYCG